MIWVKARDRILANSKKNRALQNIAESIEEAYNKSDKTSINKEWLQKIIFPERFYVEEEKPFEQPPETPKNYYQGVLF